MSAPSKIVELRSSNRAPSAPPKVALAVAAVGVVLGLAIYLIGLPADVTLFGTSLSDLTLPTALTVALLAGWIGLSPSAQSLLAGGRHRRGQRARRRRRPAVRRLERQLTPLSGPLRRATPAIALVGGAWLLPGVLGGLVVRRPGAAILVELSPPSSRA